MRRAYHRKLHHATDSAIPPSVFSSVKQLTKEGVMSQLTTTLGSAVERLQRPTLSSRAGYAVAASVIGLGLFASTTPSPLYRSYSVLWHFSPLTLTLVYATYAFGVLASLLLVGSV